VPRSSVAAIRQHPFYERLVAAERGVHSRRRQVRAARQDALRMRLGWAIIWQKSGFILGYLHKVGFTLAYRVGRVLVYRLMPAPQRAAESADAAVADVGGQR
jgi:hypothetical protein